MAGSYLQGMYSLDLYIHKQEFPGVCYVNAATMQFVHETRVNQPSLHSSSGVRIPKPGSQNATKTGAQKPVISRGPYNSTFGGEKKNSETHWFSAIYKGYHSTL